MLTKDQVHLLTSQYPTRRRPPSLGRGTNAIIFGLIFTTLESRKKARVYPNKKIFSVSFFINSADLYYIKKNWGVSSTLKRLQLREQTFEEK